MLKNKGNDQATTIKGWSKFVLITCYFVVASLWNGHDSHGAGFSFEYFNFDFMVTFSFPGTTNEATQSDIWFQFHEGYCNAVRKTVKMKDLVIK